MTTTRLLLGAALLVACVRAPVQQTRPDPKPLARAHSHNDYGQAQPLRDALDHGFTSIEADVWWQDGVMSVAHDREQIMPGRTLEALYLRPLLERMQARHGRVLTDFAGSLQLLIDVKSDAATTYVALDALLRRYQALLTRFSGDDVQPGAVTVVISGNRARAEMARQTVRYAAYDGRSSDLGDRASPCFMPLISEDWGKLFQWQGSGPMPSGERERLVQLTAAAHAQQRRLRLWATPESPGAREAVWAELIAVGVDYLNTGSLSALRTFLARANPGPPVNHCAYRH